MFNMHLRSVAVVVQMYDSNWLCHGFLHQCTTIHGLTVTLSYDDLQDYDARFRCLFIIQRGLRPKVQRSTVFVIHTP